MIQPLSSLTFHPQMIWFLMDYTPLKWVQKVSCCGCRFDCQTSIQIKKKNPFDRIYIVMERALGLT